MINTRTTEQLLEALFRPAIEYTGSIRNFGKLYLQKEKPMSLLDITF